jgi:hypothetical protein
LTSTARGPERLTAAADLDYGFQTTDSTGPTMFVRCTRWIAGAGIAAIGELDAPADPDRMKTRSPLGKTPPAPPRCPIRAAPGTDE